MPILSMLLSFGMCLNCHYRAERIRSKLRELESEFTPIKARAEPVTNSIHQDDDGDDEDLSDGEFHQLPHVHTVLASLNACI